MTTKHENINADIQIELYLLEKNINAACEHTKKYCKLRKEVNKKLEKRGLPKIK